MTGAPPSEATDTAICLIGCGNMGGALVQGWISNNTYTSIHIHDPQPPEKLSNASGVTFHPSVSALCEVLKDTHALLVLAVKPQIMASVCNGLEQAGLPPRTPLLSVAAGLSTGFFAARFPYNPLVRAMPNMPAAIHKGITALYTSKDDNDLKAMADKAMKAAGDTLWLDEESHMNAVTAVSGSGPAYVFYLSEALTMAGIEAGLPEKTARILARKTVGGAGTLLDRTKQPAGTLREMVTSPGGTTEAALSVLMDGRFQEILNDAVLKAKKRGEELAG